MKIGNTDDIDRTDIHGSFVKNEENKALGEITFGVPEKEVKKLIEKFEDNNKRPDDILAKPYYDYYIGKF